MRARRICRAVREAWKPGIRPNVRWTCAARPAIDVVALRRELRLSKVTTTSNRFPGAAGAILRARMSVIRSPLRSTVERR